MKKLIAAFILVMSLTFILNATPAPKWVILHDDDGVHWIDDGDYGCFEHIYMHSDGSWTSSKSGDC